VVARDGIEPPTPAFSELLSTNYSREVPVKEIGNDKRYVAAGNQNCNALLPSLSKIRALPENVPTRYDGVVNLTIDLDREEDGRWIADALELPGVMCYGQTRDEAISNTERLAIEVIADRIAHNELPSSALNVSFTIPDEQLASQ
jgi:predicted RNase H-like HicB family nuclease